MGTDLFINLRQVYKQTQWPLCLGAPSGQERCQSSEEVRQRRTGSLELHPQRRAGISQRKRELEPFGPKPRKLGAWQHVWFEGPRSPRKQNHSHCRVKRTLLVQLNLRGKEMHRADEVPASKGVLKRSGKPTALLISQTDNLGCIWLQVTENLANYGLTIEPTVTARNVRSGGRQFLVD